VSNKTNRPRKDWRQDATHQHKKFLRLGGVVHDVTKLLHSAARLPEHGLSEKSKQTTFDVTRSAALVASHALGPVLSELNDEARSWMGQDPEWRAEQARRGLSRLRKK
jgi:hypothetical protein